MFKASLDWMSAAVTLGLLISAPAGAMSVTVGDFSLSQTEETLFSGSVPADTQLIVQFTTDAPSFQGQIDTGPPSPFSPTLGALPGLTLQLRDGTILDTYSTAVTDPITAIFGSELPAGETQFQLVLDFPSATAYVFNGNLVATPLPAALVLFLTGLAGLGFRKVRGRFRNSGAPAVA